MKNILYTITLILIQAFLLSCEDALEQPYEEFIIRKGRHSSGLWTQSLQASSLKFDAIFDETAIYETTIIENQHDINKLYGFADCNSHHHQHSARFGWRWLDRNLEIFAYVYADGERITQYIGTVPLNEPRSYEVEVSDAYYHFYLQGHDPVSIERKATCNKGLYYMLFPYFGGNEVAPHDVTIKILTKY